MLRAVLYKNYGPQTDKLSIDWYDAWHTSGDHGKGHPSLKPFSGALSWNLARWVTMELGENS